MGIRFPVVTSILIVARILVVTRILVIAGIHEFQVSSSTIERVSVVADPGYCIKCYKCLLAQKGWVWFPWKDFPTPPWMGKKDDGAANGAAGASMGMATAA